MTRLLPFFHTPHASPLLQLAALALLVAAPESLHAQKPGRGLGFDTTNFDRSVRPQDDFYRFVNGGWMARTQIADDASSTGSFNQLSDLSREQVRRIAEEASTMNAAAGTNARKIGDMYSSALDSVQMEKLGVTPIRPELEAIAAVRSHADLPAAYARLARIGVTRPVSVNVSTDQKNSGQTIVGMSQSGLGLGNRDYYVRTDAKSVSIRAAYTAYLQRLFTLTGTPDAQGAAARVLALETAIAGKHWNVNRNRDRNATYNRMTVAQLTALAPQSGYDRYLAAAGLGAATEVVVRQPDYLAALDTITSATPIGTWKEYLTAMVADEFAGSLSSDFRTARFEMRGRTLGGQQVQPLAWKRAVAVTNGTLGEALGQLYVARHFRGEAKARMDAMVKNLVEAYRIGIDSLEWMSPATRAQAKDKLSKFTVKIGYPDRWRDYSTLRVERGELVGNLMRAAAWRYEDQVAQLGKAPDRTRWNMTPQTVNAYYNATANEIVFPAAILQPPFFDVNADDAVNYGGIGAVIGHEIGHGFDDQGRKSDGDGNLRDWWTADDAKAFEERTTKLGAQYSVLSPIDGMFVNPTLTMGENIGDLSGLAQAWRAYQLSLKGKPAPVIGGYTGAQRFFTGFAQIWRSKERDEALRSQLMTNAHSPDMYRGFVPLVNNDVFLQAFGVKAGDRMWREPKDRVRIW